MARYDFQNIELSDITITLKLNNIFNIQEWSKQTLVELEYLEKALEPFLTKTELEK